MMVPGLLVTVVFGAVERFPVVTSVAEQVARTAGLARTSWTGSQRDTTVSEASVAGELDRTLRMLESSINHARVMEAGNRSTKRPGRSARGRGTRWRA